MDIPDYQLLEDAERAMTRYVEALGASTKTDPLGDGIAIMKICDRLVSVSFQERTS